MDSKALVDQIDQVLISGKVQAGWSNAINVDAVCPLDAVAVALAQHRDGVTSGL